jgi:hypothetical protein
MWRIYSVLVTSLALAALAFPPTTRCVNGQDVDEPGDGAGIDLDGKGWTLGFGIGAQVPNGQFADLVDSGFQIQGHVSAPIWRRGLLGIRLQGGWANMGLRRREQRLLVNQIPIDVTVKTKQEVVHLGLGPQAMFPLGPMGGHAYGTVGAVNFATDTEVYLDPDSGEDIPLSTTDQHSSWDVDFCVGFGLHFYFVALDAAWHFRGATEYLPIVVIPEDDPAAIIEPVKGKANFWALTVLLWLG